VVNFLSLMFLFALAGASHRQTAFEAFVRSGSRAPAGRVAFGAMALLPSSAWKWIALIGFLFVPGVTVAYVLHSAVWILVAPGIFVLLMIGFVLLLMGEPFKE